MSMVRSEKDDKLASCCGDAESRGGGVFELRPGPGPRYMVDAGAGAGGRNEEQVADESEASRASSDPTGGVLGSYMLLSCTAVVLYVRSSRLPPPSKGASIQP